METLFRKINQANNYSGNQSDVDTRKLGANFLALQIIRVQFALNKFKSCDRFFNFFDKNQQEGILLTMMPKSWRVNVAYYKGRYHMYNNNFQLARTELNSALDLCHKDYLKNKQRILKYLIPVEMNKGIYPTEELLTKFDLKSEYGDIVTACIRGDLGMLESALIKNQDSFIQSGVFITVERLRLVTLRNFVRRVATAVKTEP